jgi:sugar phosphate isomerase/epimerase
MSVVRDLGTMITYGYPRGHLETDLAIAARLGATCVEVLPAWAALPDPQVLRRRLEDAGVTLHSAHGCWGGQTIRADRVDLADLDEGRRQAGVDDVLRCLDWLAEAGGHHLIVHPGGYSAQEDQLARRDCLGSSLQQLAEKARSLTLVVCVENMPPGVHPGSSMADLTDLLDELGDPSLALAVDTGHAHIASTPMVETQAAQGWLRSTHVHDNNGRQDTHEPPGRGGINWDAWLAALDEVGYNGPIMLECIRKLREQPVLLDDALMGLLGRLTRR